MRDRQWTCAGAVMVAALWAGLAVAQSQQQVVPPAPVAVEPPQINFGKVKPGSKLPGKFVLRNLAPSAVTVKSVTPSCKCTDVSLAAGTVIPVGGSVDVAATLAVPTTPGEKDAKVFITFEGFGAPTMAMLKADATLPIRASPAFVDALKGTVSGVVQVSSEDQQPFRVLSAGGVAPSFVNFDPASDAPRSTYILRWSFPNVACDEMPLWWVVETDRADCPLIPLRFRHECTGVRADPGKEARFWFIPEPLLLANRVAIGSSVVVPVVIEHYNPKAKGAIVRSEWSQVKSVRSLSPDLVATLEGSKAGTKDDVELQVRLAPAPAARGVIYAPIEITTATGSAVVAVSMQVAEATATPAGQ
ncbi:MAG: DUF1573 domain-containing protein [Planctomycetes bacterium]|nr:DUF1573 domain-containing protein [Planctomycetota bacterium]